MEGALRGRAPPAPSAGCGPAHSRRSRLAATGLSWTLIMIRLSVPPMEGKSADPQRQANQDGTPHLARMSRLHLLLNYHREHNAAVKIWGIRIQTESQHGESSRVFGAQLRIRHEKARYREANHPAAVRPDRPHTPVCAHLNMAERGDWLHRTSNNLLSDVMCFLTASPYFEFPLRDRDNGGVRTVDGRGRHARPSGSGLPPRAITARKGPTGHD